MRRLVVTAAACLALASVTLSTRAQDPQKPAPAPAADPYANNAAPGTTQFPLAAPAGKDSGARKARPLGPSIKAPSIRPRGNTAPRSMRPRARRSGIR